MSSTTFPRSIFKKISYKKFLSKKQLKNTCFWLFQAKLAKCPSHFHFHFSLKQIRRDNGTVKKYKRKSDLTPAEEEDQKVSTLLFSLQ